MVLKYTFIHAYFMDDVEAIDKNAKDTFVHRQDRLSTVRFHSRAVSRTPAPWLWLTAVSVLWEMSSLSLTTATPGEE